MSEDRTEPGSAIGYVVGEVSTDAFTFVTDVALAPPRLEYLVLRGVAERQGEHRRPVDVLAQVTRLGVHNRLLSSSMSFAEVEAILRRLSGSQPVIVGRATVLGYLDEGRMVRLPRGAALPGQEVEEAPDELLERFFNRGVEDGIEAGALIHRPDVRVRLDPNGLNRHLAVIAQTGAGKSYTVGVLLEQLLELGGTVLVFDPNSDYVRMRRSADGGNDTPFADRVSVYRLPSDHVHRIPDAEIGDVAPLTVQFSNLELDEICEMAGIAEKFSNIRNGVQVALERLRGDYTVDMLHEELEAIADADGWRSEDAATPAPPAPTAPPARDPGPVPDSDDPDDWFGAEAAGAEAAARVPAAGRSPQPGRTLRPDAIQGAGKALKYIGWLRQLPFWGFEDLPIDDLLRPMRLSAIDLAGVDRRVSDFVVAKLLREVWQRATRHGLARPVFLVLEEAHNFVPSGRDDGQAGYWIRRIAAEGRKFGVFLVLVTQRPGRVHADTLSQCGSQIIMRLTNPEDQSAVRRASESLSEALLEDLPGLNVGEAVALGPLVRVPVMLRIGGRRSAEGGGDLNIREALADARGASVTERYAGRRDARRQARGRSAWREEI